MRPPIAEDKERYGLTTQQVADILRVKRRTVEDWCANRHPQVTAKHSKRLRTVIEYTYSAGIKAVGWDHGLLEIAILISEHPYSYYHLALDEEVRRILRIIAKKTDRREA